MTATSERKKYNSSTERYPIKADAKKCPNEDNAHQKPLLPKPPVMFFCATIICFIALLCFSSMELTLFSVFLLLVISVGITFILMVTVSFIGLAI